uniref:Linoleate 10R-lipoxygenase (Fatty acid oxygenase ppoC) (Linoleate 10R-dioxygenase) (10R-DOX) (Psi-producing oxygenase C) (AfPpoC)) n=1 Tax=Ganoderma boninense TaxID=34458 RepID=A0A5K1JZB9_9APHY|nr:Linoleate 10R-lipoxygenase (EC (Cyclooxygenase-like fatty acid oxygenase) (Fatty acid oxygenase ppoC) (Linoleate 10R-dioxygenase) (10R-DOX) (Psi-producing oxygenase C) (AfPpoC) [Ganoderma boninense]
MSLSSPGPVLALLSEHAPAPPIHITQENLADAALDFLERYLHVFTVARAWLTHAYARAALFSVHTHTLEPEISEQHPVCHGPNAIVAALLTLPPNMTLCNWLPGTGGGGAKQHKALWDVGCVPGSASGDVLVACYAVQEYARSPRKDRKGKGKQKEKQKERAELPAARTARWSIEQRFVLRRREQDAGGGQGEGSEADRIAAALWPLVAVSHQMRVRELL